MLRSPRGQAPWGEETVVSILYILGVLLIRILDVILMHILDVLIRMHVLDVLLLLLLATMVSAPLFCELQSQSNNAAGSVVVPKTTVLSLTTVLKHQYGPGNVSINLCPGPCPWKMGSNSLIFEKTE